MSSSGQRRQWQCGRSIHLALCAFREQTALLLPFEMTSIFLVAALTLRGCLERKARAKTRREFSANLSADANILGLVFQYMHKVYT